MKGILFGLSLAAVVATGCKTPNAGQSEEKAIGRNNPEGMRGITPMSSTEAYQLPQDIYDQLYNMARQRFCFGKVANYEGTPDAIWLCDAAPMNESNTITLIPTYPNGQTGDWYLIEYHKGYEKDGVRGGVPVALGHAEMKNGKMVRMLDMICNADYYDACNIDRPEEDGKLLFSYGTDYKVDKSKKTFTMKARPKDPTPVTYSPVQLPKPKAPIPAPTYGQPSKRPTQPNPRYSAHLTWSIAECGTTVVQQVSSYKISGPCLAGNRVSESSDARQLCNLLIPGSRYFSGSMKWAWFNNISTTTVINRNGDMSKDTDLTYMSEITCQL